MKFISTVFDTGGVLNSASKGGLTFWTLSVSLFFSVDIYNISLYWV